MIGNGRGKLSVVSPTFNVWPLKNEDDRSNCWYALGAKKRARCARFFTECPIRKSLNSRSMRLVGAALTVMAVIPILHAGNVSGRDLDMKWNCSDRLRI